MNYQNNPHVGIQDEYGTAVLAQVRALLPPRSLSLSEACSVAERQALRLLQLLDVPHGPVDLEPLVAAIPAWRLAFDPRLPTSGMTTWNATAKSWVSVINSSEPPNRGRFSSAHELKHVLDHPSRYLSYIKPNGELWDDRAIETVCDYFAACLLLPRPWVKQAYVAGLQHEEQLAAHFVVSTAAARVRLEQLGLQPRQTSGRHTPCKVAGEVTMQDGRAGLGQPNTTVSWGNRSRGAYFRQTRPLAPSPAPIMSVVGGMA